MNVRSVLILCFFLSFSFELFAQTEHIPLQRWYSRNIEQSAFADTTAVSHFGLKPYLPFTFRKEDSFFYQKDSAKYYSDFGVKLMRDHALQIKQDDYRISIDPLLDFSYAMNRSEFVSEDIPEFFTVNNRGLLLAGEIGRDFSFHTGFYEVQRLPSYYIQQYVNSTGVFPGYGRVKAFKEVGYDYAQSFGTLTYKIKKRAQLELGYDRLFVGHGYRSLLLTDGISNYPFIKGSVMFLDGKLMYSSTYATLLSQERLPAGEVPESLFKRKGASFHYLSFKPNRFIELGVFEGVMWQRVDSTSVVSQPWNTYVPVLGVSSGAEGFDGKNNVYTGLNLRIQPTQNFWLYGQYMFDGELGVSDGYQGGFKWLNAGIRYLDIQLEYNKTNREAYASRYDIMGLDHVNQFVGLPSGGGAEEVVGILEYRYKRAFTRFKYNYIASEVSPNDVRHFETEWGYQLNLKTNAEVLLGYLNREDAIKSEIFYISVRTNLHNRYFDF